MIYYKEENVMIINGDCLDVMKHFRAGQFDMVLTDPPYNVGKDYGGHNDSMDIEEYIAWCRQWFEKLQYVCNGPILITPSRGKLNYWIKHIAEPYDIIVWNKPNSCVNGHVSMLMVWEPVLVYNKPKRRSNHDMITLPISVQKEVGNHPCPKSLKLFQTLIQWFTDKGDTILDPFGGSMTTAKASKNLGRKCICIEINPDYCEVGKLRLQQQILDLGV